MEKEEKKTTTEADPTPETELQDEQLQDEVDSSATTTEEEVESGLQEMKDKYLRLMAEFENYKKRTIREKIEMMSTAAKDTLSAMLPVLDDFDRAKASAEQEGSKESFPEGVKLVYNKLYRVLEQKGLKPMDMKDGTFDPDLHDAITEVPAPSEEMKGKIIDVIEKGYFLNDKLIRHAKVVVGK